MVWGKDKAEGTGEGGQVGDIGCDDAHWFVADDVFSGKESLAGDFDVGRGGCGDDNERNGWVCQESLEAGVGGDGWILLLGKAVVALDDCCELKTGDGGEYGGMEDPAGEAVAHDSYAKIWHQDPWVNRFTDETG